MRHPSSENSCIALLSGGLDSYVALAMASHSMEIQLAITFDYGHRAAAKEIETSRRIALEYGAEHKVIDLEWLKDETKTSLVHTDRIVPTTDEGSVDINARENAAAVWVPNRNGVFISIAASFAEARGIKHIITGFNSEEAKTFPDNSLDFIEACNTALSFSTMNGVKLISPTSSMTKADIAGHFCELGLKSENFWCCYHGEDLLCGSCESCSRAIRAFRQTNRWDEIRTRFKNI